jgi:hypothetical protein
MKTAKALNTLKFSSLLRRLQRKQKNMDFSMNFNNATQDAVVFVITASFVWWFAEKRMMLGTRRFFQDNLQIHQKLPLCILNIHKKNTI